MSGSAFEHAIAMNWTSPEAIIAIIAISTVGWIINNWIRAKHGYSLEDEWGGKTEKTDTQSIQHLEAANDELNSKIDAMQDRMIVLEKIVTDRGYSLLDEIEALRDAPAKDTGTPLDFTQKEKA